MTDGLNTIERLALQRLALGDAHVPKTWATTILAYQRLVEKQLVVEVEQPNRFIRQFKLIPRALE